MLKRTKIKAKTSSDDDDIDKNKVDAKSTEEMNCIRSTKKVGKRRRN